MRPATGGVSRTRLHPPHVQRVAVPVQGVVRRDPGNFKAVAHEQRSRPHFAPRFLPQPRHYRGRQVRVNDIEACEINVPEVAKLYGGFVAPRTQPAHTKREWRYLESAIPSIRARSGETGHDRPGAASEIAEMKAGAGG